MQRHGSRTFPQQNPPCGEGGLRRRARDQSTSYEAELERPCRRLATQRMTERRDQAESGRTWTSAAPVWLIVSVLPDNFPDEERAIMVPMSICNGTHNTKR